MFGMDCFYRRERSNTKEKKKKKRKVVTVGELKHTMRCLELFSLIKMIEFTLVITFQGLSRRKCFYFQKIFVVFCSIQVGTIISLPLFVTSTFPNGFEPNG